MVKSGKKQANIARRFGISTARVRLVVLEIETETALLARRSIIREDFKRADNTDRKWNVVDILDSLDLIAVAKSSLTKHFQAKNTKLISLREFMDMAVPQPKCGSPLFEVPNIGKIAFCSVVNELTKLDMGTRCNAEWKARMKRINHYWKITGPFPYSDAWMARLRQK